jgi:hypothetical protein
MAMWHGHRAPIFLLLRTFARTLTCSLADSGVHMRTQCQPQFPHELLNAANVPVAACTVAGFALLRATISRANARPANSFSLLRTEGNLIRPTFPAEGC